MVGRNLSPTGDKKMRHISFDESTVLNELVKIAHKNGLVKTAQEVPMPKGEISPASAPKSRDVVVEKAMGPQQQKQMFLYFLKKYPSMASIYKGERLKANKLVADMSQLGFKVEFATLRDQRVVTDPNVKQMVGALQKKLNVQMGNLKRMIEKLPEGDRKKSWEDTLKNISASAEYNLTKSAKGDNKNYDVTDETGEQLVNKAHPGGTRTELTHSKTDENLVETIVEQQKKDVEVAHSIPKGTYAELMNLYGALKKAGHKEHLDSLRNAIKIVADVVDTNEIINYTLTVLANRLGKMGLKKSASKVNDLLKNISASPTSDNFKQDVLSALQGLETDRFSEPMKQSVIKEWQSTSMPTLVEAMSAADRLSKRWRKMFPSILPATQNISNKYSPALEYEQKSLEPKRNALGSLKNISASPTSDQFKQDVLSALQGLETDRFSEPMKRSLIKEWQMTSMPTLVEAMGAADRLSERWGRMFPSILPATQNVSNKYSSALEYEQKLKKKENMNHNSSQFR